MIPITEQKMPHPSTPPRASFTLIELLIVIAVIAVLATVVILTLNPADMLRRSRDANRLSDFNTLKQAIAMYQEDVGVSLGASSTLYISVPDPLATSSLGDQCQGLGLSTSSIPSGWTYHCAGAQWYKNVDGTGWIPVDFQSSSFGSPIGTLPVDPVNTTSSGLYYTYVGSGDQYELTALMESGKYATYEVNDGGLDPAMYEVGTNLTLSPFARRMGGYWTFDEGSGTVAYDSSGMGNNGAWNGTPVGTSGYYSAGKVGPWAGAFDGSTTYMNVFPAWGLNATVSQFTIAGWVYKTPGGAIDGYVLGIGAATLGGDDLSLGIHADSSAECGFYNGSTILTLNVSTLNFDNAWHYLVCTYDGSTITLYVDGQALSTTLSTSGAVNFESNAKIRLGDGVRWQNSLSGQLDDVRLYDRALSAAEIQAIYNSQR